MTSFTVQSQVDSEGNLSISLPGEFQGQSVTVVVQVNRKDPIEVLRKTAGSIPDLERRNPKLFKPKLILMVCCD